MADAWQAYCPREGCKRQGRTPFSGKTLEALIGHVMQHCGDVHDSPPWSLADEHIVRRGAWQGDWDPAAQPLPVTPEAAPRASSAAARSRSPHRTRSPRSHAGEIMELNNRLRALTSALRDAARVMLDATEDLNS